MMFMTVNMTMLKNHQNYPEILLYCSMESMKEKFNKV